MKEKLLVGCLDLCCPKRNHCARFKNVASSPQQQFVGSFWKADRCGKYIPIDPSYANAWH